MSGSSSLSSSSSSLSKSKSSRSSSSSNSTSSTSPISSASKALVSFSISSAAASNFSKLNTPALSENIWNPVRRSSICIAAIAVFLSPFVSSAASAFSSAFFCFISAVNAAHHSVKDNRVTGVPSSLRLRTSNSSFSAWDITSSFFWDSNCCAACATCRSASFLFLIICACILASSNPLTLLSASHPLTASHTAKIADMPSLASASSFASCNNSCLLSSDNPLIISKSN
mmetsp:Transcript_21028/g.37729  ORF Transcript_21028/g.37729 Transcript_21028/m.37729 type:complete len:229 (-) Transcript_21028:265-951(-)